MKIALKTSNQVLFFEKLGKAWVANDRDQYIMLLMTTLRNFWI